MHPGFKKILLRLLLLLTVLGMLALATRHYWFHDHDWDSEQMRLWILSWGALAPLASLALMTIQALLSPIPFALVAMANGAIFGAAYGLLLSCIGEALGAATAYQVARAGFARDMAGQGATRLRGKLGFWQLVGLRMIPGLSVDLISYACGALAVPRRKFLLSTVLGLLPRTILLSFFGEELLDNPGRTLLAGLALGVVLAVVALYQRLRPRSLDASSFAERPGQPGEPLSH
ncbi:TVP38/TMEM64 family protein [bacterium]|nr:TVP38/TMEM64 family protein [bacterium]